MALNPALRGHSLPFSWTPRLGKKSSLPFLGLTSETPLAPALTTASPGQLAECLNKNQYRARSLSFFTFTVNMPLETSI